MGSTISCDVSGCKRNGRKLESNCRATSELVYTLDQCEMGASVPEHVCKGCYDEDPTSYTLYTEKLAYDVISEAMKSNLNGQVGGAAKEIIRRFDALEYKQCITCTLHTQMPSEKCFYCKEQF